jgi:hypothetical protein
VFCEFGFVLRMNVVDWLIMLLTFGFRWLFVQAEAARLAQGIRQAATRESDQSKSRYVPPSTAKPLTVAGML